MEKIDLLYLKNRKIIYEFILDYPGIHLRKIIKEIGISEGTIRYHLKYLIKHELITSQKKNGFTRFYVSNSHSTENKKLISYIRNENTRLILLFFHCNVCGSLTKICNFLEQDKKEISVYLKKLKEDNIIEFAPVEGSHVLTSFKRCKKMQYYLSNGEKVYRLKDPYKLNHVLISLKSKFLDDGVTDDIIDCLLYIFKEKNNRPKTLKDTRDTIDNIEDLFFEIFPHPYHI